MRLIAILVAVLLAGCDTEADMKIVGTDVQVLSNAGVQAGPTAARPGAAK